MGQRAAEGFWWARLGEGHLTRGQWSEAETFYRRALERGRQLKYSQLLEEATAGLGAAKEAEGDAAAALKLYTEAIALIEKERQRFVLDKEKAGYFVDKLAIYERMVRLLVRCHQSDPSRDYADRAFEYAERATAQAFLQKVPQGIVLNHLKEKSEGYQQWDAEYRKERDRLYSELLQARRTLERLEKNPDSPEARKRAERSQVAAWERKLAEQEKGHVQFVAAQVRRLFLAFINLYEPEVLGVRRIQGLLRPGEVLLKYHVQEKTTMAFVIGPTGVAVVELPFGRTQREDLMSVIEAVRWSKTGREKSDCPEEALITALEGFYRKLFAPVEKFIPTGSALILVPDDYRNYLSFGMRVTARPGGRVQYLIERYPLAYVDSASLLNPSLFARSRPRTAPAWDALLIGNPDRHGLGGEGLIDLPYAEAEVDAIRPYFKRTLVLKGRAATEGAFKGQAPQARVVHVAGHHLLDAANPWRSRLVLALDPQVNRDGNDGFVYTYELFALDLDAEMVVLSACNSGSGTVRMGEGLEGPTRALRYAGARSVLATLWPVKDQATGILMPRFYNYLAQGLDKRRALQQAQMDLIRAGYPHPHDWAGFRLTGDPGPLSTPLQKPAALWARKTAVAVGLVVLVTGIVTLRRVTGRRRAR